MPDEKKTCFVVMGFGEKVDLATGRKLNLDASYHNLIKPTVEAAGLECIRADEIAHSGNINVPMYERILTSDLVIADLSTANNNAFYELGVRHALRPYTTIIIAEEQFNFPFDVAQISIRKYKHLGDDIGVSEARRFREEISRAIQSILANPTDDSPVYTFLRGLRRLRLPDDLNAEGGAKGDAQVPLPPDPAPPAPDQTHSVLMQQVAQAKKAKDFVTAKALLTSIRAIMRSNNPEMPEDPYIIQQLALVTYKSNLPTPQAALKEARDLLKTLDPATSNDTETLGMWGAVHKRLWDLSKDKRSEEAAGHLDEAVRGYERGFYLRNDYYNGINLAFLLNTRAAHAASPAEAVADFVQAARIRREVLAICDAALKDAALPESEKYWVLATRAEALLGMGETQKAEQAYAEAYASASDPWMSDSTKEQRAKLEPLLADSPLKYVKTDAA